MQPQSPNPNYDFILKNNPAPKKRFNLPLPNLPKPVLIGIGGIIAIIFILIVLSAISNARKPHLDGLVGAVAQAQEISRVSTEVQTLSQDTDTQSLAATVTSVLASEQSQLTSYLSSAGVTPDSATLAEDMSTATDNQMKAAATTGDLTTVFATYLSNQLNKYQLSLQAAYNIVGPHGKDVINSAYNSNKALLASSLLN